MHFLTKNTDNKQGTLDPHLLQCYMLRAVKMPRKIERKTGARTCQLTLIVSGSPSFQREICGFLQKMESGSFNCKYNPSYIVAKIYWITILPNYVVWVTTSSRLVTLQSKSHEGNSQNFQQSVLMTIFEHVFRALPQELCGRTVPAVVRFNFYDIQRFFWRWLIQNRSFHDWENGFCCVAFQIKWPSFSMFSDLCHKENMGGQCLGLLNLFFLIFRELFGVVMICKLVHLRQSSWPDILGKSYTLHSRSGSVLSVLHSPKK